MAAVYKTLSGTNAQEKESGERKNKQRVLILVCDPLSPSHIRHTIHMLTGNRVREA